MRVFAVIMLWMTMTAGSVLAETLPVLSLSPGTPSFSTGSTSNPTYYAWTYEAGAGDGQSHVTATIKFQGVSYSPLY